MPPDPAQSATLDTLSRLSSAEDIFAFLGLVPEAEVLNVSRLHVMKRFGAYLSQTDCTGRTEAEVADLCREALLRAQADFRASSPLQEKVFKVFETQAARQKARFVGLETLTVSRR